MTQVEVVDVFRGIRSDPARLGPAMTMLEIADQVTVDHQGSPALYRLLVCARRSLEATASPVTLAAFCLKALMVEGVGPSVDFCAHCGREEPLVAFDAGEGGFLCHACRRGQAVSPEVVDLAKRICSGGLALGAHRAGGSDRRGFGAPRDPRRSSTTSTGVCARRATISPRRRRRRNPGLGTGDATSVAGGLPQRGRGHRWVMSEENPTAERVPEGDAGLFDAVVNLASGGASSSPPPRSTAASARPTTTGRWGALMLRNVRDAWWRTMVRHRTTSCRSRRRSSRTPRFGRRPATSRRSSTRWSTAVCATSAGGPTRSRGPARTAVRRTSPRRGRSTSCSRRSSARSTTSPPSPICARRRRRGCSSTSRT